MQRAVIYVRVSTKEQATSQSLDSQYKICADYCRQHDFEIVEVFRDEGESAKTTHRKDFLRMLAYCTKRRNNIQFLVVQDLTRFSRNTHDHEVIRHLLLSSGVRLRSCREPVDETAIGKLTGALVAAIGQFENDIKGETTTERMKAHAKGGRYMWKAPLGYRNSNSPSLIEDPTKGPLIRKAFELYQCGRHTKQEALDKLSVLGLTTRKGKKLTAQSFGSILKNPVYCGRLVSDKWELDVAGDWQPLVDNETFERVQAMLSVKGPAYTVRRKRDHGDFPLRRLVRCAACNQSITGSWSTGKLRKKYAYYRCRQKGCVGFNVKKETLEARFVELMESLKPKPRYMMLFREIVLDVWNQRRAEVTELRRTLGQRVATLQERIDRLVEAYVHSKSIDRETYEAHVAREREALALARIELNDMELQEIDVEGLIGFAEYLLGNAARAWHALDQSQRLRFQCVLFPHGVAFDGESFRTPETSSVFSYLQLLEGVNDRVACPRG